jgi:hypothetical protein
MGQGAAMTVFIVNTGVSGIGGWVNCPKALFDEFDALARIFVVFRHAPQRLAQVFFAQPSDSGNPGLQQKTRLRSNTCTTSRRT